VSKLFEEDCASSVHINFLESCIWVGDLCAPLIKTGHCLLEFIKSNPSVSTLVHALEHHEIFEVLAHVKQEDTELRSLDVVLSRRVIFLILVVTFGRIEGAKQGRLGQVYHFQLGSHFLESSIDLGERKISVPIRVEKLEDLLSSFGILISLVARKPVGNLFPINLVQLDSVQELKVLLGFLLRGRLIVAITFDLLGIPPIVD
jgi:hypothetical protein